jgi:DNA-directed RNA polymerase sigma subunit (sigma70/sigma32)
MFDVAMNSKSNKVKDKIEKQRALFNHDFYDVLVEVEDIADDFELQCKTDAQTYCFSISKDALEHLEAPLHKIYATEQIRRVEKYMAARRHDENKGYKEQIVEIAVEYQIDSKYTAFIAVNERDEKLTDIPNLQDIVLEAPSGWSQSNNISFQTGGMRMLKITSPITNRESASLDKYRQELANEKLITVEEEVELAQRIRKGDSVALEKMCRTNYSQVLPIAEEYQNLGLSLPDLINEGNIGLIRAAKRFDETKGLKFSEYALWWIRLSILKALAGHLRIERLPSADLLDKINKFGQENKIILTAVELAELESIYIKI